LNILLGTGHDTFTVEVGEADKEETNILAGPGNDHIIFFDGQFITGFLDGEAGLDDTMDYSLWTGSVTVNMVTGRATGILAGSSTASAMWKMRSAVPAKTSSSATPPTTS